MKQPPLHVYALWFSDPAGDCNPCIRLPGMSFELSLDSSLYQEPTSEVGYYRT